MGDMSRMLGPLAHRISNMLSRGSVAAANAAGKMQALQVRLLAGEVKDIMEHFEPFGFTSKPLPGAEAITAFFDGDRSHGVVLVVADRRYRLRTLDDGEVALHDAYGNRAHFKKDGTLDLVATTKVAITSPLVTVSGNLQVAGTITGTVDVIGGGKSLKTHTHSGVQAGASNTGQPN